jgi:hypothetical protein
MTLGSFLLLDINLAVTSLSVLADIPLHLECVLFRCVRILLFPLIRLGLFIFIKVFYRFFFGMFALLHKFLDGFFVEQVVVLALFKAGWFILFNL